MKLKNLMVNAGPITAFVTLLVGGHIGWKYLQDVGVGDRKNYPTTDIYYNYIKPKITGSGKDESVKKS